MKLTSTYSFEYFLSSSITLEAKTIDNLLQTNTTVISLILSQLTLSPISRPVPSCLNRVQSWWYTHWSSEQSSSLQTYERLREWGRVTVDTCLSQFAISPPLFHPPNTRLPGTGAPPIWDPHPNWRYADDAIGILNEEERFIDQRLSTTDLFTHSMHFRKCLSTPNPFSISQFWCCRSSWCGSLLSTVAAKNTILVAANQSISHHRFPNFVVV